MRTDVKKLLELARLLRHWEEAETEFSDMLDSCISNGTLENKFAEFQACYWEFREVSARGRRALVRELELLTSCANRFGCKEDFAEALPAIRHALHRADQSDKLPRDYNFFRTSGESDKPNFASELQRWAEELAASPQPSSPGSSGDEPRCAPMPRSEIAKRFLNKRKARSRDLKGLMAEHGLRHEGGNKWTICLGGFDPNARKRLEAEEWSFSVK